MAYDDGGGGGRGGRGGRGRGGRSGGGGRFGGRFAGGVAKPKAGRTTRSVKDEIRSIERLLTRARARARPPACSPLHTRCTRAAPPAAASPRGGARRRADASAPPAAAPRRAPAAPQENLDPRARAKKEGELGELRARRAAHEAAERERKLAVRYHKARARDPLGAC